MSTYFKCINLFFPISKATFQLEFPQDISHFVFTNHQKVVNHKLEGTPKLYCRVTHKYQVVYHVPDSS